MKIAFLDAKTVGYDISLEPIKQLGDLVLYDVTKEDEIDDRLIGIDVAITNKTYLSRKTLEKSSLKLVALTSTGTNTVDLEAAKDLKIAVCNVPSYSTKSVVQHTFAILLYMLESLKTYDEYVKNGEYSKNNIFTTFTPPFYELDKKVFGIIGLGEIGRNVAKIAEDFGCEVIYYSTSGKNNNSLYPRYELDDLLEKSDIVSIHAALNDKTKNLITYDKIKLMKKTAYLLNLGRGAIINEKDLAKALDDDLIKGCCLDVMEKEPILMTNPLMNIKNPDKLLLTPHIAWASVEARTRLVYKVAENITEFTKGNTLNRVDL